MFLRFGGGSLGLVRGRGGGRVQVGAAGEVGGEDGDEGMRGGSRCGDRGGGKGEDVGCRQVGSIDGLYASYGLIQLSSSRSLL